MVLLVRLTRIVPPQSCAFMGAVDKGCATAGKYETWQIVSAKSGHKSENITIKVWQIGQFLSHKKY